MPALLFHQNMKNYGGGFETNLTWKKVFEAIQGETGKYFWAAGFSELLASGGQRSMRDLPQTIGKLAQSLDDGLTSTLVIAVGESAGGTRREFIGIAWDGDYLKVEYAGHVLRLSDNTWCVYDSPVGQIKDDTIYMPEVKKGDSNGWRGDSRGVAYIAARRVKRGTTYIFGFMHNEFGNGDRSGAFKALTSIAESLPATVGKGKDKDYEGAIVVIGGDFNVVPGDSSGGSLSGVGKRTRSVSTALQVYAAKENGDYVKTTDKNPYDFWVANKALKDPKVSVHEDARIHSISDHSAITLRVV